MNVARLFCGVARYERKDFDALVHRYHSRAYNVAYRMTGNHADADDLTQETFLRAYRFIDRYDPSLPFENWLYRVMSRVYIDEIRKQPRIKCRSLDQPLSTSSGGADLMLEIPDFESDPGRLILSDILEEHLQSALNALPEQFRLAVILADIEELSYEEIGYAMHCSLGTVRSRINRGRNLLRLKLGLPTADKRGYATSLTPAAGDKHELP